MSRGDDPKKMLLGWVLLCCAAVIAISIGGYWFYRSQKEARERDAEHLLSTIARYRESELTAWIRDQIEDASALQKFTTSLGPLADVLADPEAVLTSSLEDFLRYMATSHDVDHVALVDRSGRVRFCLGRFDRLHSEDLKVLAEAMKTGRPAMTDLHADPETKEGHIGVVVPVFRNVSSFPEAVGGLFLMTNASRFIDFATQAWPLPTASGEVLLVRREGEEVVYLNALRHKPDAAFSLRLPLNRQDLVAAMAARGVTGVVRGTDYRGVPVLAVISPVTGTSWYLVTKIDRQEIEAENRHIFYSIGLHVAGFASLLIALVLWARQSARKEHYRRLFHAESELRRSLARQAAVLQAMADAVIATDDRGRVELWNPGAEKLTGWSADEVLMKPLAQVLSLRDAHKRAVDWEHHGPKAESPLEGGENFFVHTRDGRWVPVAISRSAFGDTAEAQGRTILCLRDQSRERLTRRIMEIRLELMERADAASLDEVLPQTLEAVGELLESPVGFYVSLGDDSSTVQCIHWSENVREKFCAGGELPGHMNVEEAGLWADALREKKPIIVNDYRTLTSMRGLPEGHGPLYRFLAVPVIRDGLPRALLALANKATAYTEIDAETLWTLAGLIHQVVEHRKAVIGLRQSEERYKKLFQDHKAIKLLIDPKDGRIADANRAAVEFYGWSHEELTQMFIHQINTLPVEAVKERIAEVQAQKRVHFEFQHRRADGSVRDVEVYSSRIDVNGRPYLHSIIHDVTARKQMEAERARWLTAIEQAGEAVLITDAEGVMEYVNPAFETVTGYAREEAIGRTPAILKSGLQDEAFYQDMWATLKAGKKWSGRMVNKRKDGTLYTEEITISPVKDAQGNIVNYVGVMRDISEKLRLEQQFFQAQKMESVGRLAGGVAHDFNNSLTIILGFADLALREVPPESAAAAYVHEIIQAAERSAAITRQLLAFARKQIIEPVVMDLNSSVEGTLKMLRRLIGEDIELVWKPGEDLWKIKMDPGQLDQILANLCVNAKDAIGGVGTITIETKNVTINEMYCATHVECLPGDYVLLMISDSGCGMDAETLSKIFEPFFTTKEIGKGTGLGLSTVYGIVRQNQGFINVYSEPGRGTTFKIYIPRVPETEGLVSSPRTREEASRGKGETILLVEDDPVLLEMTEIMLRQLHYTVLTAPNPSAALSLAREHRGPIDLLMTDVVMPEMNGKELALKVRSYRPDIKVLFMSGHTADVIGRHGVLDPGVSFLQKPFVYKELAERIRRVLENVGT